MKIMFHGKEIELNDKLEEGEDLDLFENNDLENTIEIPIIEEQENKRELDLSKTQEFGEINYE